MTRPERETCLDPEEALVRRFKGFDLCADDDYASDGHSSSEAEMEDSNAENYLTPQNLIPYYFEFPPTLRRTKNDNNYYFDLGSVGSDLYIPHPLSCEGTEETESTVLLPSFVRLSNNNIDGELLSMPSFGEVTSEENNEGDDQESEECSTLPCAEITEVGGDDANEKQKGRRNSLTSLHTKRPPSATHPLNVSKSRRKSLGAGAA